MIFEYNEYNEYKTLFWVHMVKTVQHKLQELLMDHATGIWKSWYSAEQALCPYIPIMIYHDLSWQITIQLGEVRPNTKQNRGKIHSHENVVCYVQEGQPCWYTLSAPPRAMVIFFKSTIRTCWIDGQWGLMGINNVLLILTSSVLNLLQDFAKIRVFDVQKLIRKLE